MLCLLFTIHSVVIIYLNHVLIFVLSLLICLVNSLLDFILVRGNRFQKPQSSIIKRIYIFLYISVYACINYVVVLFKILFYVLYVCLKSCFMDDLDSYFDLTSVAQLPVELFLFSVVPYNYGKSTVQKKGNWNTALFLSQTSLKPCKN